MALCTYVVGRWPCVPTWWVGGLVHARGVQVALCTHVVSRWPCAQTWCAGGRFVIDKF